MTAQPVGGTPVAVRRLPVPLSAPPFDDERAGGPPLQGALALDYALRNGLPAVPAVQLSPVQLSPVQLSLVRLHPPAPHRPASRPARGRVEGEGWAARQPTTGQGLPDPRAWVARLVQGLLEVLSGERPAHQLARWTDETLFADLTRRAQRAARRAAVRTPTSPHGRPYVRSVHTCEPVDGVVEATAVVQAGGRCRAVVVRLEGWDGRWRATVAQMV